MKNPSSYAIVLKYGEVEDTMIRGISVAGGEVIKETLLQENPPKFIEVKGKVISTSTIAQVVPIY